MVNYCRWCFAPSTFLLIGETMFDAEKIKNECVTWIQEFFERMAKTVMLSLEYQVARTVLLLRLYVWKPSAKIELSEC